MNSKTAAVLAIGLLCVASPAQSQSGDDSDDDTPGVTFSLELCSEDTILVNMVNSVEFAAFQMTLTESDGVTPLSIVSAGGGLTEDVGTFLSFGPDTGIILGASFTPGSIIDPSPEPRTMVQVQLEGPIINGPPQIQELVVSSFLGDLIPSAASEELDECSLPICEDPAATFGGGTLTCQDSVVCAIPEALPNCPLCFQCVPASPTPAPTPVPEPTPEPTPTPTPTPTPSAVVKSDPHFVGFNGQSFDFHGQSGNIYCLLNDHDILINAAFAQAWETGVDGDVALLELNVRAKKGATWVSKVGLTVKDVQISVSVHRDAILESICPKDIGDSNHDSACFMGGSIEVNGQPVYKPGVYSLEGAKETFKGSSGAKKGAYSIELYNFRSFGRVTVEGPLISAYIDYIPPPLVWDIVGEVETYSHLNLQINRIMITKEAHGIIGQTIHTNGQSLNKVVEGKEEDYIVNGLFDAEGFFKNVFSG